VELLAGRHAGAVLVHDEPRRVFTPLGTHSVYVEAMMSSLLSVDAGYSTTKY